MAATPVVGNGSLDTVRALVDGVLDGYLRECADDLRRVDPAAPMLVDEISRLVFAGGKRLRPAFCVWGYRAVVGTPGALDPQRAATSDLTDHPILRAAAALELLHTMALIHDDLMDGASERRGVASSAPFLAAQARERGATGDPERFGHAAALLAGDLAAVLADRLLLTSGFDPASLAGALGAYHEMQLDMAAGQLLDVAGMASDPGSAMRAARLKGGSYTVEGPLLVGAALAGARQETVDELRAFGIPLGEAFQLRDDLHDREGAHGATPATVNELVRTARGALLGARIDPEAAAALDELAAMVAMS
jgi:geranylgeranyl diphosphate synthase type I